MTDVIHKLYNRRETVVTRITKWPTGVTSYSEGIQNILITEHAVKQDIYTLRSLMNCITQMTLLVPKGQDPQQGERECFFHPKLHMLRACHYEIGHRAVGKNERTTVEECASNGGNPEWEKRNPRKHYLWLCSKLGKGINYLS